MMAAPAPETLAMIRALVEASRADGKAHGRALRDTYRGFLRAIRDLRDAAGGDPNTPGNAPEDDAVLRDLFAAVTRTWWDHQAAVTCASALTGPRAQVHFRLGDLRRHFEGEGETS